jgi:PIN domain nuclease of toxin-antitoxin system
VVLDASAILAVLYNEVGVDRVLPALPNAIVSTVNLAEVYSKTLEKNVALEDVHRMVAKLKLISIPFDEELAFITGTLREPTRSSGFSLGDRACLALGLNTGLPVLTGDKRWIDVQVGVEVILFR